MRTHRSLKRRGLPWPRWALRGRLCRPNSSSWLRLSGSSMWGSSSSSSPGTLSDSSRSVSTGELVNQLVGEMLLVSGLSWLDTSDSSLGLCLEEKEKVPLHLQHLNKTIDSYMQVNFNEFSDTIISNHIKIRCGCQWTLSFVVSDRTVAFHLQMHFSQGHEHHKGRLSL